MGERALSGVRCGSDYRATPADRHFRPLDPAGIAQIGKADLRASAFQQGLRDEDSEAQMAVETAVAVRDKVVEAYLEILRMPV